MDLRNGGPTDAHVVIETFFDPLCPNSKASWSTALQVIANVINRNHIMWYNDATKSMVMPQVIDSLVTFVDEIGLVSKDKFMNGMMGDDINDETNISWKYVHRNRVFTQKK